MALTKIDVLARLIPARAGNTSTLERRIFRLKAHPRSRGEHGFLSVWGKVSDGSSPLARGTPCNYARNRGIFRLIPARAGNTWMCTPGLSPYSAHPRSRGEHAR